MLLRRHREQVPALEERWPETPAPRVRPMMVWVATLLPDPDSPTMPSVWPGSTLNETPRTAWTMPSSVLERHSQVLDL